MNHPHSKWEKYVVFFVYFVLIFSQNWRTVLMADEGDMRLPKNVLPYSYDIKMIPIIEEGNFTTLGYIEILVDCLENTSNISMNSADISIDQYSILVTICFDNCHPK
jgi:hypothetical protein